jgi:hypothetical protein
LRSPALDCTDCTDKKRKQKNCNNWQGRRESITHLSEWNKWPESLKPSEKWGDLKFWECPRSAITTRTWEILALVNETVNSDGDVLHLPFEGQWLKQPQWYRQAVSIVKRERADHRSKELAKQTNGKLNGKR